ncbi:hypothetical protein YK56LOC_33440 [Caballeronia sp. HLA56]
MLAVANTVEPKWVGCKHEAGDLFAPAVTDRNGFERAGAHREERVKCVARAEERFAAPYQVRGRDHLFELTDVTSTKPFWHTEMAHYTGGAPWGIAPRADRVGHGGCLFD